MTDTFKGRCLCGEIGFEFSGKPLWIGHCHCESCRRNTSSPITTFVSVPREAHRFTRGETRYYESSPGVRRHFCGNCGTPMAFDADRNPGEIHFYVVSLERPDSLPPKCHFFTDEKISWFEVSDTLPRYRAGGGDAESD